MSENKMLPIEIPKEEIEQFCQRHHIRKLSLFGSVLRDDFRPDFWRSELVAADFSGWLSNEFKEYTRKILE